MIDFPLPILSVSTDVVKHLDGQDALYGMWTVFTKCKQSLKDGRRLENISWRLWYREMATVHPNECHSPGSTSPAPSDDRCPSPITPLSEDGPRGANSSRDSLMPAPDSLDRHSWHGDDHPPPSAARRLSTASMPVRPRSHPAQCVGSIILDILPATLVVPAPIHNARARSGYAAPKPLVPVLSHPGTARPSPVAQGATSTGPSSSHPYYKSNIAQPRPVIPVPTLNLPPSTPPNQTGAPRVVVVNPTPHPTPPATPQLPNPTSALPSPARTHLIPPLVRPALGGAQGRAAIPSSKQDAPKTSHPEPTSTALPLSQTMKPATSNTGPPSRRGGDDTLKPSDRRFFLQTSESPDQDSPERGGPVPNACKSPDVPELSPSSGTSSHVKSEDIHHIRRSLSKPGVRRGKEAARAFATARPAVKRQLTAHHRKTNVEPKKTTFNIGSASSHGTRSDSKEPRETSHRSSSSKQNQTVSKAAQKGKKGLVLSTSSEYTTDSDDSGWASEGNSVDVAKEKERLERESRLKQAAEEAQRQRDMFAKVDRRSYTSLNRGRSGLLSQLLNPDPQIFPPDHPYRVKSLTDMTRLNMNMGHGSPSIATSKSSAALPLMTQITPMTAQAPPASPQCAPKHVEVNGYRPKGRPQGQEMDDDDSETEDEGDNGIQLSHSLAQQRLAALAGPGRRRASDQAVPPPTSRLQQQRPSQLPALPPPQRQRDGRPPLVSVATAPIPLAHPYNLPAPAAPMTPRTTRRQMLSTELSESLRRNLLWERQVSKTNVIGGARRSSGVLGQGLRPLTAVHAGQQGQGQGGQSHTQQGERLDEREERKRAMIARNRSWADDYHYAGW